jgi:hypothetical protein
MQKEKHLLWAAEQIEMCVIDHDSETIAEIRYRGQKPGPPVWWG